MVTQKTEAKIIISAQDTASPVLARLQAQFDRLSRPIQGVQKMLAGPMELAGVNRLTGSLGRLQGAMQKIPFAGSLFAAGGMYMATKAMIDNSVAAHANLGALQDLSDKYKVSTDSLQVYGEMAADSGTKVEDVANSIGFLQKKIAGARSGDKGAIADLGAVGVNSDDLKGNATDVFNRISEVYKNSVKETDEASKVAFAKAVFGKAGTNIIPMLDKGGPEAYAKIMAMMREEGRFFEKDQVAAADGVDDAWGKSMRRIEGMKTTIGLAMGPMLGAISTSINKLLDGGARADLINTFKMLGDTIGEAAPKFIAKIPDMVEGLADIFRTIKKIGALVGWDKLLLGGVLFIASPFIAASVGLVGALGGVALAIGGVIARLAVMAGSATMGAIRGVQGIALAMRIMGLSAVVSWTMALGPIVLVGAVLAGVAYLIYRNWGGVKAFFVGVWQGFTDALAPVADAFAPVTGAIGSVVTWIGELFGATTQSEGGFASWASAGRTAGDVIATMLKTLLTPLMVLIDTFKVLGATWDMVNGKSFSFQPSTVALWSKTSKDQQGTDARERARMGIGDDSPRLLVAQVANGRTQFDGKVDVRVFSDGRAQVERVESNNRNMEINALAGSMHGITGAY